MKRLADIYSEHGILQMIQTVEVNIQKKEKEYKEVEPRVNPLMVDGYKKELKNDIELLNRELVELNEALKEKRNAKNN